LRSEGAKRKTKPLDYNYFYARIHNLTFLQKRAEVKKRPTEVNARSLHGLPNPVKNSMVNAPAAPSCILITAGRTLATANTP
jgi:hypothetical protein